MPHQCTTCGHGFEDGSKEMLGGCPSCGGTTFQFYPKGTEVPDEPPENPDAPETEDSSVTNAVGRASTTVRNFVARDDPDPNAAWPDDEPDSPSVSGGDGDIIDADARVVTEDGPEDGAQASARGDLVDREELARQDTPGSSRGSRDEPSDAEVAQAEPAGAESTATESVGAEPAGSPSPDDGRVVSEPADDQPELSELRDQLNDQFESIKIVEPGQYELNLMELYDREEYVIALQENGRYVIQVPENWLGDRMDE